MGSIFNNFAAKAGTPKKWVPPASCQFAYSFSKLSGNTVIDACGKNNGYLSGTIGEGKVGAGIRGSVSVGGAPTRAMMTYRHVIAVWLKLINTASSVVVYYAPDAYEYVEITTDRKFKYEIYSGGYYTYYSGVVVPLNQWFLFTKSMQPDNRRIIGINAAEVWSGLVPTGVDNGDGISFRAWGGDVLLLDNPMFFSTRDYTWSIEQEIYNNGKGVYF